MSSNKENEEVTSKPLPPVWVYGINDHLDLPAELPAGFEPSGSLVTDFRQLCEMVGAAPHPAFKVRKKVETTSRPLVNARRPSIMRAPLQGDGLSPSSPPSEKEIVREGPHLAVRSVLLDRTSMGIVSLLLPFTQTLRTLCFSDCNLDCDMLKLLAAGLVGNCSVESLQLEWNILDLPLPTLSEKDDEMESRTGVEDADVESRGAVEAMAVSASAFDSAAKLLEARERKRYTVQSERLLRNFKEWLESIHGSLGDAWRCFEPHKRILGDIEGVDCNAEMQSSDFHVVIYERLNASGPQVLEVFEVLDGPDFGTEGGGRTTLNTLKTALENLPEEKAESEEEPLGQALAAFMDSKCVLESLSVRACAVSRVELVPMCAVLAKRPWHLRSLNLWDNRICDRGAELLAGALDVYRGLEYVGLGKNRISDVGLQVLCKPFSVSTIEEADAPAIQQTIAQQEAAAQAVAAAKDKAVAESKEFTGRQRRVEVPLVDELEEKPPVGDAESSTFLLRRQTELRCLVLSENPIKSAEVLEALQPHGPRGAELVLRFTPAAAELGAKRPELLKDRERRPLLNLAQKDSSAPAEGWILRISSA
eukprot:TRINITY_DN23168_c0_g1_i1.p1 TRINITY_DN23168_c0_g1~~TRINITY_DN23168_c0_g1_i1.p1  ORF type:complete len:592 (+),score=136.41 TRINITY_DN23168_c0_g1_i1:100-1875(+)